VLLTGVILLKHYVMPWMQKVTGGQDSPHGTSRPPVIRITCAIMVLLGLISLGASWGRLSVKYPYGKPDTAYIPQAYYDVMEAVQVRLTDNSTFMTMTNEAFFYYLGDQPCPVRFPVVWFAMPPFYQEEITQQMAQNDVQVVIYKSTHWSNYIDGFRNTDRLPALNRYILSNYMLAEVVEGHEIWVRRE